MIYNFTNNKLFYLMTLNLSSKQLTHIPNFNDISVVKSYGFKSPDDIIKLNLECNKITKIEKINKVNFYRDL